MSVDFSRKLTLTGALVTLRPAGRGDAAVLASLLTIGGIAPHRDRSV